MDNFTYEAKERNEHYETYEWDNTWIDHANDLSAKRVLYIGDSISCGARRIATALTNEQILFDGFGTSKGIDNKYFKDALKIFANQESRRDAVLFNNGLHGWHLNDETEYATHYEDMIKFLLKEFENTQVFIVLTTYVANEERASRVAVRNKAAKELADKYNLPVIDLHTLSIKSKELLSKDGVHFSDEGYNLLAGEIIQSLLKIFPDIKL